MNHINDTITNYLTSNEPDYALMINGEWGSGKTYYIQKQLIEGNSDFFNFIYCTAYGINSTQDIIKQIAIAKNPVLKTINNNKPLRIGTNLASGLLRLALPMVKLGSDIGEDANVSLNAGATGQSKINLSDFWSFKQNDVLIIDDIERTGIDVKELFGFISANFLNQKACKVILVCSEKELFKQSEYNIYKEKVVRHTIKFEWQPELIVPLIIAETIPEEELRLFLIGECNLFLLEALSTIKGRNLRKFKFFLSNIQSISSIISFEKLKNCYQSLFQSIFLISNEYINGNLTKFESYQNENLQKHFSDQLRNNDNTYNSVWSVFDKSMIRTEQIFNLITKGYVDHSEIDEEITKYIKLDNPEHDWGKIFEKLKKYNKLSQLEFDKTLDLSIEYIESNKYDAYELGELTKLYITFHKNKISNKFTSYTEIEEFILKHYDKSLSTTIFDNSRIRLELETNDLIETPSLKSKITEKYEKLKNDFRYEELIKSLEKQLTHSSSLNSNLLDEILTNEDTRVLKKLSEMYISDYEFAYRFVQFLSGYQNKPGVKFLRNKSLSFIRQKLEESKLNTINTLGFYHLQEYIDIHEQLKKTVSG